MLIHRLGQHHVPKVQGVRYQVGTSHKLHRGLRGAVSCHKSSSTSRWCPTCLGCLVRHYWAPRARFTARRTIFQGSREARKTGRPPWRSWYRGLCVFNKLLDVWQRERFRTQLVLFPELHVADSEKLNVVHSFILKILTAVIQPPQGWDAYYEWMRRMSKLQFCILLNNAIIKSY